MHQSDTAPLHFTSSAFGVNQRVIDESGLPWGVLVRPTPNCAGSEATRVRQCVCAAEAVAKCGSCFAVFNLYCTLHHNCWECSVCGKANAFVSATNRYDMSKSMSQYPESSVDDFDLELPLHTSFDLEEFTGGKSTTESSGSSAQQLAYLFIVDETGSEEFLELVKSSIEAALKGLPDSAWIGILSFSNRIGVYDLSREFAQVKTLTLETDADISLQDFVSLEDLLVPVWQNRQSVVQALEELCCFQEAAGQRWLGDVVKQTLELLGTRRFVTRCSIFLNGIANCGSGSLKQERFTDSSRSNSSLCLLQPDCSFYEQQARVANQNSVCFDLYAISELAYLDLASLLPLARNTGGQLVTYTTSDAAAFPQDLFRNVQIPMVFDCELRLLSSVDFHARDPVMDYGFWKRKRRTWLLPFCSPHHRFGFKLSFASGRGFPTDLARLPILQMAFAYSFFTKNLRVMRRIRVVTVQIPVVFSSRELLQGAHLPNLLTFMVHQTCGQVTASSQLTPVQQGLMDWLSTLVACYHKQFGLVKKDVAIDVEMEESASLHWISRAVFGLLSSQLMRSAFVHPDSRICFISKLCHIAPDHMLGALYPQLMAFQSVNDCAHERIALSRVQLLKTNHPIFLLDSWFAVLIVYLETCDAPFPPPHDTLLRQEFESRLCDRTPAPKTALIHERESTTHDALEKRFFSALLLDDCAYFDGMSYQSFAQTIRGSATKKLS